MKTSNSPVASKVPFKEERTNGLCKDFEVGLENRIKNKSAELPRYQRQYCYRLGPGRLAVNRSGGMEPTANRFETVNGLSN